MNNALVLKWRPPLVGFWKINTDAASYYKDRLIGLGVICRDRSGMVKLAASQKMIAMVPPFVAEALAIKYGIQLACETCLVPLQIESDSLQAMELVSKSNHSDADVGPIIVDISNVLKPLPSCSISYVPRKRNDAAHVLAKKALSVESDHRWIDFCPPYVERIV
ncbi:hypothetical protein QYF36_002843 [Acer negundo]|nr:hypothetical protein QYF36_002843 [Acer negundo]